MIGRVRQCKEFRLALNQKQKIEIKAHRILHGKQQASVLEDGVAANITAFSRMRANLIEAQYKHYQTLQMALFIYSNKSALPLSTNLQILRALTLLKIRKRPLNPIAIF